MRNQTKALQNMMLSLRWLFLLVTFRFSLCMCLEMHVGTVLNLTANYDKQYRVAMDLAVEDVNTQLDGNLIRLHTADIGHSSNLRDVENVLRLYGESITSVTAPLRDHFAILLSSISDLVTVPLITYAAQDASTLFMKSKHSIMMAGNDLAQMNAITYVLQQFHWREVVAIFEDSEYGLHGILALNNAMQNISGKIVKRFALPSSFNSSTLTDIMEALNAPKSKTQSRVFVIHSSYEVAKRIFLEAHSLSMVNRPGHAWIISEWASSFLDAADREVLDAMKGVIGVRRHISVSGQSNKVHARWKAKFQKLYPNTTHPDEMGIVAYHAYDSILIIAKSLKEMLQENGQTLQFKSYNTSLSDLKVFLNGDALFKKMLESQFEGASGNIRISKNGFLDVDSYDIVNIANGNIKIMGSWDKLKNGKIDKENIYWPNGSLTPPSGLRKFIVGVPRGIIFSEYVNISYNHTTGHDNITGFCIEVFKECVDMLPYDLNYQFKIINSRTGSPDYDQLVERVKNKEFDALVADITVLSNRTALADFTQPYTDTGLAIMVPLDTESTNKLWIFVEPFTLQMWLTALAFVIITAFLVWLLEHGQSNAFTGSTIQQIETSFWFSLSTIVFAQREKVATSLGKLVLVMWLFVVLILNSSYTASLTSILTVQQLSPSIKDIDTLKASDKKIGHLYGSFVHEYLTKQLRISESRLVQLHTVKDYVQSLENGSIGAVVDETPYLNILINQNCGKFTLVGQRFYRGGFGFVFTKDSPIVDDMNYGVLKITQNRTRIQDLRNRWLNDSTSCDINFQHNVDDQLGPPTFGGLFIFTAASYIILLCAHYAYHKYQSSKNNGQIVPNEL